MEKKVAALKAQFETLTAEATKIKMEVDEQNKVLQAAESLVSKLQSEFDRWSKQVNEFRKR